MKTFAYIALLDGTTSVYVSETESETCAFGIVAGQSEICPTVTAGARAALARLEEGKSDVFKNELGNLMLLGPVQHDQVIIKHHPMFLVTVGRKTSYWLVNTQGRFDTAEALEKYLSAFSGWESFEWSPVSESNVNLVLRNLKSLEELTPKIVVVLEDGNPIDVQVGGLSIGQLRVQVLNIVHTDDISCHDAEAFGVLTYGSGVVHKHVVECTPNVNFTETADQVAQFI